jgi:hypothetical protein
MKTSTEADAPAVGSDESSSGKFDDERGEAPPRILHESLLQGRGVPCNVETSGSRPAGPSVDWSVVSDAP